MGVVWQHVTKLPPPDAGGKVVTRSFLGLNLLTAAIEKVRANSLSYVCIEYGTGTFCPYINTEHGTSVG